VIQSYDYEIFILEEVRVFAVFAKLYTVYGSTSAVFTFLFLLLLVVIVYEP